MRRFAMIPVVALVLLLCQTRAWSILIEVAPGKRVGGYVENETPTQLSLRVKQPDGKDKVEIFDKAKILVVHRVQWEPVGKLEKANPKGYRDLAEELAPKADDPEARDLALRLFLIAAYLDPDTLGRSSLLQMAGLAATPEEARKYRAMAFLLDPRHDATLLQVPAALPPAKIDLPTLDNFLQAVRYYRVGELDNAKRYAQAPGVAAYFGQVPGLIAHQQLIANCTEGKCKLCSARGKIFCTRCGGKGKGINANKVYVICPDCVGWKSLVCSDCSGAGHTLKMNQEQVQALLRAELWGLNQTLGVAAADNKEEAPKKWTELATAARAGPVPGLTLETLTSFDPRQCVYRNGKWVEP